MTDNWVAHHGLTSEGFQQRFDEYVDQGYRLTHVSGYTVNGEDHYAAIWEEHDGASSEPDTIPAVEYAPDRSGETRTRVVELPGSGETVEINYRVIDSKAIVEGDIVLGDADEIESSWDASPPDDRSDGTRTTRQALIAKRGKGGTCQQLWPNGVVRFRFSGAINAVDRQTIRNAMDDIENNTNIQFVSRSDNSNNFIEFVPSGSSNAGSADVGYTGERQEVRLLVGTSRGLVIHELLHALGAWHEQTRNDRDRYVNILWNNILQDKKSNFEIHSSDGLDIGEYDYNSIMHYSSTTFGRQASGGGRQTTIRPTTSGVSLGNTRLSTGDIDGLRQLYPYERRANGGHRWGSGYYATSIAFGDVDGDGRDEVGITRNATENMRFAILGADPDDYRRLHTGGEGWGDYPATDIAFGDVDGDGRDEVGITRNADRNHRFKIKDDFDAQFEQLFEGGNGWGSNYYATDLALGDVDGDGNDEIAVCRYAHENARYWIYDGLSEHFDEIACGGYGWGSPHHATGIAIGNSTDRSGVEPTVGVSRKSDRNARYWIHEVDI